jgi:predicted kinase
MRKWMTERLKRRKKTGDETAKDGNKAPEPLQPRFYDDEPSAPASVEKSAAEVPREAAESVPAEVPAIAPRRGGRSAPAVVNASDSASEPVSGSPAVEGTPRTSRRRRSRGGRGGSRSRAAVPAVAAVAESSPAMEESEAAAAEALPAAEIPAAAVPVAAAAGPARASKGTVVLAIGLPGSGKSSWFKRHNIHPLSSDLLRELLFDDAQEQRFQDLVFSNLRSMLKARLIARRPMNYVDATNLTPHDRHSWIKLAKDYGYDVQGLFFDVPLDVCMERHQRRGRAVPEDIMRKMAGKLKAPTFEEGFSKITVVRVKQKDAGGVGEAVPTE